MSMKEQMLKEMGYTEWSVDHMGMLVCPCGRKVEDDGECPNGHVSPLRENALI